MPTRFFFVDDTDSRILYEPASSWTQDDGRSLQIPSEALFGPPHLDTVTGTTTNSSFSFDFTGSSVDVSISLDYTGEAGFTVECYADGEKLDVTNPGANQHTNRHRICGDSTLRETSHTLSVNITYPPGSSSFTANPFWLDYISYAPLADTPVQEARVVVREEDPSAEIELSRGWGQYGPGAKGTNFNGANLTYQFRGTSVSIFGFYSLEISPNPSEGQYTIDGGEPQTFRLYGNTSNWRFNRMHFNASGLTPEKHTLVMSRPANASGVPLVFQSLMVTPINGSYTIGAITGTADELDAPVSVGDSDPPTVTVTGGSDPSPTNSSAPPSSLTNSSAPSSSSTNVGAIAGGVVAGVVVLGLLLATLWYFLRKRQQRRDHLSPNYKPEPYYPVPRDDIAPAPAPLSIGFSSAPELDNTAVSSSLGTSGRTPGLAGVGAGGGGGGGTEGGSSDSGIYPAPRTNRRKELIALRPEPEPEVIRHHDSGVRLRREELPPLYTPD